VLGVAFYLLAIRQLLFKELNKCIKIVIIISFMSGVAFQIILAMLNKWIHWCIYWGKEKADFQKSRLYKFAERVSAWFWIDVSIDLLSFIAFGIATVCVFYSLCCSYN
jgi:hypothetical protein